MPAELLNRPDQGVWSVIGRIGGHELGGLEALLPDGGERGELTFVQKRRVESDKTAVGARILEKVAVVSQIQQRRGDVGLAQRVNGRVSHLREQLVEVVVEASRTLREARERRVLAPWTPAEWSRHRPWE